MRVFGAAPQAGATGGVGRTQDGEFFVSITVGLRSVMAVLSGERLGAFREQVDREAMPGQVPPVAEGRACCDHCNNLEGDPSGHDYGDTSAHAGPCDACAAEADRG